MWLETNLVRLEIADLPPGLVGLRILHLTDFHLCDRVPISHIRQAVEQGRKQNCDVVALTGDFVHAGFRHVDAIASLLGRFSAPLGVYAVLGNHDYSVRNIMGVRRYPTLPNTIADALRGVGIDVLHNEHRLVQRGGAPVAIAGVADLWSRELDVERALQGIPAEVPRIVLAHNPASIERLGDLRSDIMLSGHTHGGQIHVEGYGPAMLTKNMRDYAAGLYRQPSGYLYVNKGVGFTVRFRYRVRPEIAVLELTRGSENGNDGDVAL